MELPDSLKKSNSFIVKKSSKPSGLSLPPKYSSTSTLKKFSSPRVCEICKITKSVKFCSNPKNIHLPQILICEDCFGKMINLNDNADNKATWEYQD